MTWYYWHNEQTVGPVSEPELESLIYSGALSLDVQVWREGMADWQPYGTVKVPGAPAQSTGLRIARHDPAPVSAQLVSSPTETLVEVPPVGQRIVAKLIDIAFMATCIAVIAILLHWLVSLIRSSGGPTKFSKSPAFFVLHYGALALGYCMGVIMRNRRRAARQDPVKRSIGKRLMKIAVVDTAGRPLSTSARFSRAVIQLLMVGLTFFLVLAPLLLLANRPPGPPPPPVYTPGRPPVFHHPPNRAARLLFPFFTAVVLSQAGYAVALFNRDRRGLHDLLCNTRVILSP